eukprot:COSAG02_NODE_20526_length_827_cov_0.980769_1_plen_46_part_01
MHSGSNNDLNYWLTWTHLPPEPAAVLVATVGSGGLLGAAAGASVSA